ncbi:MAG: 50S ribosomal protein L20 [Verrucomicrobiae bacterium]|nr:50S ribosomal protein L20 [Verrucomicrobiae bacterium]MCB1085997.1 50S ribosomal protein L20 [Verrucomicrobiae bacterium]
MPRATNAPASRKRRKRWLMKAKGFYGARSKLYRYAKDAVFKAQTWAYRDRKTRKRNFRALWIQRISAAVRERGMTYSRFTEGLKAAGVELDRKVLADLAIADPDAFGAVVEQAKAGLDAKATAASA